MSWSWEWIRFSFCPWLIAFFWTLNRSHPSWSMIRQSEKKSRKREIEKKKKEYDYEDREMMKQILDCSRFLMLKMNGHETRASLLFAAIRESSHDFETLQFSFPSSLLVLSFDLSDMCCCSNSNCKWITVTMIIVLKKRMIWWHQCFNDG